MTPIPQTVAGRALRAQGHRGHALLERYRVMKHLQETDAVDWDANLLEDATAAPVPVPVDFDLAKVARLNSAELGDAAKVFARSAKAVVIPEHPNAILARSTLAALKDRRATNLQRAKDRADEMVAANPELAPKGVKDVSMAIARIEGSPSKAEKR